MCKHRVIQIGDCKVCIKCGMTLLDDNKIFLDRKLPNYKSKKKGGKNEQKF